MVRHAEWRGAAGQEGLLARADGFANLIGGTTFAVVGFTVCCGIGALPGIVIGWAVTDKARTLRRLERLRDVPSRYAQHACRMTLKCDGLTYGEDEGLVSFVDGTMLFEGRRTTFSATRRTLHLSHQSTFGFGFGSGRCYCTISPLNRKEFEKAVAEWLVTAPTEVDCVVLPPICPDPTPSRKPVAHRTLAWGLGLTGVPLSLAVLAFADSAVAFLVMALFAAIGGSVAYGAYEHRQMLRSLAEVDRATVRPPLLQGE